MIEGLLASPTFATFLIASLVLAITPGPGVVYIVPQFIDPGASPLWQSLALSCVFVSIAVCTDTLYMLMASALAPAFNRRGGAGSYGRYITAVARSLDWASMPRWRTLATAE